MEQKKQSARQIAGWVIPYAMKLIRDNGGKMRMRDIVNRMEEQCTFTDYEKQVNKSGGIRWKNVLSFWSIAPVKTGYLVKNKGVWALTNEGEQALNKGDKHFFDSARAGYDVWFEKKNAESKDNEASVGKMEENESNSYTTPNSVDELVSEANNGIIDYIKGKNPYEFQELVGALLRAMGYYTPFIAPKGRDGGIDIIAYTDPLGATAPTLKVQVKHTPNTNIAVDVVRSLAGVIDKTDDVGIVVTSGGFTNDALRESRRSNRRLRLIDIDEFINLWVDYYPTMGEQDKLLLPLVAVYVVNTNIDEE